MLHAQHLVCAGKRRSSWFQKELQKFFMFAIDIYVCQAAKSLRHLLQAHAVGVMLLPQHLVRAVQVQVQRLRNGCRLLFTVVISALNTPAPGARSRSRAAAAAPRACDAARRRPPHAPLPRAPPAGVPSHGPAAPAPAAPASPFGRRSRMTFTNSNNSNKQRQQHAASIQI